MYLPSPCLGLLVEEEATAKVKGNSFPLPPLLISCPFKTGPVRQDNNADYTRSGPWESPVVLTEPGEINARHTPGRTHAVQQPNELCVR